MMICGSTAYEVFDGVRGVLLLHTARGYGTDVVVSDARSAYDTAGLGHRQLSKMLIAVDAPFSHSSLLP